MYRQYRWQLLVCIMVFMFSGCGVRESGQALSFKTLMQDSELGIYRDVAAPEIFVIANAQEVDALAHNILNVDPQAPDQRQHLVDQLRQIDFDRSFAILVTPG